MSETMDLLREDLAAMAELHNPPEDHEFRRSGFSFLGKLLGLGYPLLDARTSCKLPQYLPYLRWGCPGQLAI